MNHVLACWVLAFVPLCVHTYHSGINNINFYFFMFFIIFYYFFSVSNIKYHKYRSLTEQSTMKMIENGLMCLHLQSGNLKRERFADA